MKALALGLPLAVALLLSGCANKDEGGSVQVRFDLELADGNHTSFGSFVVETDDEHAPVTVENFLAYVDSGYYVNLTFHRVAPNFVVQGGGYEADYETRHEARAPIPLEATVEEPNVQWSLSMARTGVPNSATSEFFVNLKDNPTLDPSGPNTGYAVFGRVVSGFDTIEKMVTVEPGESFGAGGFWPKVPIVIVGCERV